MRGKFEEGQDFDASEGLLLAEEVAAMYGVDRDTANEWARNGRVPHIRTPGGHFRFSRVWHRQDREARSG